MEKMIGIVKENLGLFLKVQNVNKAKKGQILTCLKLLEIITLEQYEVLNLPHISKQMLMDNPQTSNLIEKGTTLIKDLLINTEIVDFIQSQQNDNKTLKSLLVDKSNTGRNLTMLEEESITNILHKDIDQIIREKKMVKLAKQDLKTSKEKIKSKIHTLEAEALQMYEARFKR